MIKILNFGSNQSNCPNLQARADTSMSSPVPPLGFSTPPYTHPSDNHTFQLKSELTGPPFVKSELGQAGPFIKSDLDQGHFTKSDLGPVPGLKGDHVTRDHVTSQFPKLEGVTFGGRDCSVSQSCNYPSSLG